MIIHRYESTHEQVNNTKGPVIFLAGPTVRGNQQHLQPSWRFAAIDICKKLGFEGSLIIPEFTDIAESDKGRLELPLWEYNGLKRADAITFWIPRTRELIGLTTNFEHGYWMGRNIQKVVYGRPDESFRNTYTDIMWNEIHRELGLARNTQIHNTLEDTLVQSIEVANTCSELREKWIEYNDKPPYQGARL